MTVPRESNGAAEHLVHVEILEADAYRDPTAARRAYLAECAAGKVRERARLSPSFRRVHARRIARAAAGVALSVTGVVLFGMAAMRLVGSGLRGANGTLTSVLLLGWLAAAIVFVVARVSARVWFDADLDELLDTTGDPDVDLERMRNLTVERCALDLAARPARASVAWPLVGLSLVMPLTIHWVVAACLHGTWRIHAGFDQWIVASTILVGHCHVLVAIRAWRFGRSLCDDLRIDAPPEDAGSAARKAWCWSVVASLVPGALLVAIPTVLVAATGLFIPVAFVALGALTEVERASLERASRPAT